MLRIRDNSNEQLNWLTLPSIITNTTARKKGLQSGKRYHFSVMPVIGGENVEGNGKLLTLYHLMIINVMVMMVMTIINDDGDDDHQ